MCVEATTIYKHYSSDENTSPMDLTTSQLTMTELSDIQRHGLSDLEKRGRARGSSRSRKPPRAAAKSSKSGIKKPSRQRKLRSSVSQLPKISMPSGSGSVGTIVGAALIGSLVDRAVGKVTNSRLFGGSRHKDQSEQAKQPAEKEPVSTQPTQTVYVTMAQTSTTASSTSAEPVTVYVSAPTMSAATQTTEPIILTDVQNVEPDALLASQNAAPIIKNEAGDDSTQQTIMVNQNEVTSVTVTPNTK
ncbi:hypothetical protein BASA50_010275 [Batrachochytrium salamandrivorans]|uniref:Uncharacterized protein n=1 Tax=Batrachochytrium salamandrivorans TaxID=1357716 RepID=A0ABQ8EZ09_9FUNG|nr:hypothetical protein BASA50_010275 [Batrachochytrium salamandrivorans]